MTRDEMKELEYRLGVSQLEEEKRHNKAQEGVTRRGQDFKLLTDLVGGTTKLVSSAIAAGI